MRIAARLTLILLGVGAITACQEMQVGPATYPRDYVYLEQDDISDTMSRLSVSIWTINDILDNAEVISGFRRDQIVSLLKDMEEAANDLGAGGKITNHPIFDNNIDNFKADVQLAREAIQQDPPNYYRVGRLSGSCLACHALR